MPVQTGLYIQIPNLKSTAYVRPDLILPHKSRFETQTYGNEGLCVIDNSPDIVSIFNFLLPREPNKQWLRQQAERFEREGYGLNEKQVREIYRNFRNQFFIYDNPRSARHVRGADPEKKYVVLAELLDWQPEKRIPDYRLPQGANAVLYRDWIATCADRVVNLVSATKVPVNWPEESGKVPDETTRILGVPTKKFEAFSEMEETKNNLDGLSMLLWDFEYMEYGLLSGSDPTANYRNAGFLQGKKQKTNTVLSA